MKRMCVFLGMMVVVPLVFGCKAQVPKPTAYDFSTQQKMQAVHHWDILANDMATQIAKKLQSQKRNSDVPLYVENHSEMPFTEAFYDLLVGHLVDKGVWVTTSEQSSLVAEYDVQLVHHSAKHIQRPWPGAGTATASTIAGGIAVARNISGGVAYGVAGASAGILTGAAVDALSGYHVSMPQNEVLVTTTVADQNTVVLKKADVYYINDKDFWHYMEPDLGNKNVTYTMSD